MKDAELREMAANRGLRLAKSRRRKAGGDFGLYGLKDAKTGAELFGFSKKGLTATAEEIEAFLRGGAATDWKRSLGSAGKAAPAPSGRKKSSPDPKPPQPSAPKPKKLPAAKPSPPKAPKIRSARRGDAEAVTKLVSSLGYEVTQADITRRMTQLSKAKTPLIVAELDGVIGCVTWHVTPVLHRPRPVGRITLLVVAEDARGRGIGRLLVAAAEERLTALGCGQIEVTSNMRRARAHAFYEGLGYERTSFRFMKPAAS